MSKPKYKVGQWVIPIDQKGDSDNEIGVPQKINEILNWDGDYAMWYLLDRNYSLETSVILYHISINSNIKLL